MATAGGYPQLPTTVWRGVWNTLNKAPSRKLDERILAIDLGVQETAARQYLKELQKLGITDKDGQPTSLGDRWRQDGADIEVINTILAEAYPEGLRQLAPPEDLDRDKIVRWFQGEKLGTGAAKNKAATYMMLAQGVPSEVVKAAPKASAPKRAERQQNLLEEREPTPQKDKPSASRGKAPQLAVNVQIHISADATSEQIDSIFSAMRRYFDEPSAD